MCALGWEVNEFFAVEPAFALAVFDDDPGLVPFSGGLHDGRVAGWQQVIECSRLVVAYFSGEGIGVTLVVEHLNLRPRHVGAAVVGAFLHVVHDAAVAFFADFPFQFQLEVAVFLLS